MSSSKERELQQIQRQFLLYILIDTPGAVLFGLGLYGLFAANGDAFIALLNNQNIAIGAIVMGAAIMMGSAIKIIQLLKRKAELLKE